MRGRHRVQADSARGKVQTLAQETQKVPADLQRGAKNGLSQERPGQRKTKKRQVPAGCFQPVLNRLLLHSFIYPSINPGPKPEAYLCGPIFSLKCSVHSNSEM